MERTCLVTRPNRKMKNQVRSCLAGPGPPGSTDHCFGSVDDEPRVIVEATYVFNKCRVGLAKLQKRAVCVYKVDGGNRHLCRKSKASEACPQLSLRANESNNVLPDGRVIGTFDSEYRAPAEVFASVEAAKRAHEQCAESTEPRR